MNLSYTGPRRVASLVPLDFISSQLLISDLLGAQLQIVQQLEDCRGLVPYRRTRQEFRREYLAHHHDAL